MIPLKTFHGSGSANPAAASAAGQTHLPCDSKAAAIAILKTSAALDANTKAMLSPRLVLGIILAEAKRIGRIEKGGEHILPIDIPFVRKRLGGQGPGQLYPPAHADVEKNLKAERNLFLSHMGMNCGAGLHRGCGRFPLTPKGYPGDVVDPITADFFISGYLALRVKQAQKAGRSPADQLQFGIGLYFGARRSIVDAQKAISPKDDGESVTAYAPVKSYLQQSSDQTDRDVAAYIEEVFRCR